MRKNKIFLLIISLSVILSCAKETEIGNDIVDYGSLYKKMPVVLSQFSNDSILFVKFGTTEPAFNKEDAGEFPEILNPVISDLKNGTRHTLEKSSTNAALYSVKMNLEEGAVYQIDADFPDFDETHVFAYDTIPYVSKIQSLKIISEAKKVDNDLLALVQFEIAPSLFQNISHYEISVVTTITDTTDFNGFPINPAMLIPEFSYLYSDNPLITIEDYYPSILQFDAFPPTNLYFKMVNNSETFLVDFYYSPPMSSITNMGTGETTTHIYSHSASIFLKTVSSNYYKYHVSRLKQFYSREGDPLYGVGEPVNVYTNIQNGTGIFASYTCDSINYSYKSK
jgi:hypothetical protein